MFQVQTIFFHAIALVYICSSYSLDAKATDVNDFPKETTLIVNNLTPSIINKDYVIVTWNNDNFNQHSSKKYEVIMGYKSGCCFNETFKNISEKISRKSNIFLYAFEDLCPDNVNKIDLYITSQGVNSINKSLIFQALPREPSIAPVVDVGSFFIDNTDSLHIYWKQINLYDYNGKNFMIQITNEIKYTNHQLNDQTRNPTIDIENSSATFEKDWFNTTSGAKFKLQASNIVGPSMNTSYIEIPSKERLCGKPENIQVVELGNIYHISWTKPIGYYNITSYTVFWCASLDDSPTQCDSPVDFERVFLKLEYNLTSTDRYLKFAVSANTKSSTSGMTWEQCKAETDSSLIGQIDPLQNITTSTNKIELEWAPKCKDVLIVKNYIVEYCPVKDMNSDCFETKRTHITSTNTYSLDNLKSNTMYRVIVIMQSETTMGPSSIPQYFTTTLPVWLKFATYIMLIVFLLISSGISVYWSYFKITQMKDIKVNIPFGLDLDKDNLQMKSMNQTVVPAITISNERLSIISEAETLDSALDRSSMVELLNLNRKGSLHNQDSAVTKVVQHGVIQADLPSGPSSHTPQIENFMIHPVLNIESSPTLVQPSYYRERFQDEPDSNTDSKKLYNTRIIANGYVLLHDMASQKRD